jgi:hypothetical protein
VVTHLSNDPIVVAPSFTEGFESAAAQTYFNGTMGFNGLDRCDFHSSTNRGRARTFIDAAMVRTGNRAVTLDQDIYMLNRNADSLITTFNLSNYSSSGEDLWLSLYFRSEGIDFSAPGNKIWIRGSDRDAWIPVYTLPYNPADFGVYRAMPNVNITQTLANASPVQTITSSFQVKCGQEGHDPARSVTPGVNNDGFTFDDITIRFIRDDVGTLQLINAAVGACSLGASEPITIQVKNYSSSTLNNVPVSYRINNNTPVTEHIPAIAPGDTINYTFTQTADMSAFKEYAITAWTHYSTDTYSNNDTIVGHPVRTTPLITSFPYLEGFEGANAGNWYSGGTNSSWQCGTPSGTIINKAANGNKAWVTNVSGNYNNNERSYLYSPCFDLSGLVQPVLSFSHNYKIHGFDDHNEIEYSTDGQTWQNLSSFSGNGWLWHVSSFDIPTRAATVRFRFSMYSNASVSDEGVGIDDVHIFDKSPIYLAYDTPGRATKPVSGNNWIDFTYEAPNWPGYQLFASINANGQDLGNTDVSVYINPDWLPYNDGHQYYLGRNLVIHPTNTPTAPVKVRFYFLDHEFGMQDYAQDCSSCAKLPDAYAAGITQYSNAPAEEDSTLNNNNSGIWRYITPSQVEIVPYDEGYYAEFEVSNFSEFWINPLPRLNQPLPLQLAVFTVIKVTNTALLQWSTYSESNTSQFIIERSTDGINYIAIGTVPASENSNTKKQYRFTDEHPATGINYYRLKQTDKDGKFSYSSIRNVSFAGNNFTITVKPNPVTKGMVNINSTVNCNRIELRDATGRLIKTAAANGMQTQLPVQDVSSGIYFITVVTDNGRKVEKIIIQ